MPPYLSTYTTPTDVIRQVGKATSATITTSSDDYLLITSYCKQVSAYMDERTGRHFVPYKDTKSYYFRDIAEDNSFQVNRGRATLYLDDTLLVTSSVMWQDVAVSATYYRERGELNNQLPYVAIDFDTANGGLTWSNEFADSIDIIGIWGYHYNLSQAFVASGQTMTVASSSTTSATVSDGTAFLPLQYIRVESELMQITAISGNTLTLSRGVNGYTASSHTSASIEIYYPLPDVALCATRIASYCYQNKNSLGSVIQFNDGTTVVQGIEAFIQDIMRYKKSGYAVKV